MTLESDKADGFDRALELTKFGKFNAVIIFLAGIVLGTIYLESTTMNFVLPISQCDIHWTQNERNLLGAVTYIGIIISSHFWGSLGDSKGRKIVLCPTLIVGFILSLLSSFSNSFAVMFTLRLFNGICISGGASIIIVYLGEFHTPQIRDKCIMFSCFISSTFTILSPIAASFILRSDWYIVIPWLNISYTPWRSFIVVAAFPGLVAGFLLCFLPESPKYYLSKNQDHHAIQVLQKIFTINTGKPRKVYPIENIRRDIDEKEADLFASGTHKAMESIWSRAKPLLSRKYVKVTLVLCILQFVSNSTNFGMFLFFPDIVNSVETYLKSNGSSTSMCEIYEQNLRNVYNESIDCVPKLEDSTFAYSLSLEIIYFLGFLLLSLYIKKVKKIYLLSLMLAAVGLCGFLAVLLPNPRLSLIFYTGLLLSGFGIMIMSSSVVESYPTHLRATAMSLTTLFARAGCVFGTNYFGSLFQNYCNTSFYISGGFMWGAAALALLIPKPRF